MSREIRTHQINPANREIAVIAEDGPGPGGASHVYRVTPRGACDALSERAMAGCELRFQNGAVKENGEGVNGITHEAMIAVILDRLEAFQAGPYKCRENALAITKLEEAMHWLHHRTRARELRGVEGTMKL